MAAERLDQDGSHELRLEGSGLLLGGGLLLAAVVGAFLLGGWMERRKAPPPAQQAGDSGPLEQMAASEPDAEATDGLTYFDDLVGKQQEAEPSREMPSAVAVPPDRQAQSESTASDAVNPAEPWYVQVIALRDQRAAGGLIDTLKGAGYRVQLFTEREGEGTLYKVRVGGYRSEKEARAVSQKLRDSGYPGAFVRPLS